MATTVFPKPLDYEVSLKLNANQGSANAGKILKVDTDGTVIPDDESAGTVVGVKMNNGSAISPDANGVVDLGTVITSHQDITGKLDTSLKGAANGLAELDQNGKVPSTQLPSYVDDVLEYAALASFPASGETGKIYVAQDTNKTYRWSGTAYVEISESLALGETSSTAYRGDRGAAAYAAAVTNVDSTPTANSTNLITSGGVAAAIPVTMTGATSSANGTGGLLPAPTSSDYEKFFRGDGTWQDGGRPMVILSYGSSTWAEFLEAYNNNVIVYCRASSNSNPASGSQTRMAFMTYVNNADNPTSVEFQYYRSVNSKTASQMGDQVFVYKLDKTAGWTVETREASIKTITAATGTKLSVSYNSSSGSVTLTNTMTAADMDMSSSDSTKVDAAISALNSKIANFVSKDYGTLTWTTDLKTSIVDLLGSVFSDCPNNGNISFCGLFTGRGALSGTASRKNSMLEYKISALDNNFINGYYASSSSYTYNNISDQIDTFIKSKTFSVTTDATGCTDINASNLGYLRTKCLILAVVTNITTGDTVYPIIGVYRASTNSWTIKFQQGNSIVASQTFDITVWYVLL